MTRSLVAKQDERAPSAPRRGVRSLLLLLALPAFALACGPTRDSGTSAESSTPDAEPSRLVIESLEVGVGFDEPVWIDDSEPGRLSTSTRLALRRETDESLAFTGGLWATDAAGNASEFHIEVRVDDAPRSR